MFFVFSNLFARGDVIRDSVQAVFYEEAFECRDSGLNHLSSAIALLLHTSIVTESSYTPYHAPSVQRQCVDVAVFPRPEHYNYVKAFIQRKLYITRCNIESFIHIS